MRPNLATNNNPDTNDIFVGSGTQTRDPPAPRRPVTSRASLELPSLAYDLRASSKEEGAVQYLLAVFDAMCIVDEYSVSIMLLLPSEKKNYETTIMISHFQSSFITLETRRVYNVMIIKICLI